MEILNPKDHEEFMEIAWEEAKKAKCQKSHFGAIIVKEGIVLAKGHNKPIDKICEVCLRKEKNIGSGINSELCFSIHAEQNALLQALKNTKDISNAVMYIGHIKDGQIQKFSGKPYCTICSRLIAGSELKGVIFYTGDNYLLLTTKEFNEKSFETIIEKHNLKKE